MSTYQGTKLFVDASGKWVAEVQTFDQVIRYGHFKRYELAVNYVRNILGVLDYLVDAHACNELVSCITPEW